MSRNNKPSRVTIIGIVGILVLVLVALWSFFVSDFNIDQVSYNSATSTVSDRTLVQGPIVKHVEMPKEVRGIYMTACYGASKELRSKLLNLIKQTELNAIVIDIKDYTGTISVPTEAKILAEGAEGRGCKINDIKSFIEELHDNDIYVIGRITVFQDPLYAKNHPELAVHKASVPTVPWSDYKGLHFIDVGAKKYWDYIITLARESHDKLGFDELNFDYIRYPSDGPMKDVYYSLSGVNGVVTDANRAKNLEKFFVYLHEQLSSSYKLGDRPMLSADLFGMTATNYDDLTIGQVLERTLPYFDAVAPMVYPSHYPPGFIGLKNPNSDVYSVVNYSMKKAVERTMATSTKIASFAYTRVSTSTPAIYKKPIYSTEKMRPWLQDFDYGGNYGIAEVNAQIKASRDAGVTGGYMIWDPANRYTRGVSY